MDKQFLMFAVNNNLTLFVSLEINDGSEKKERKRGEKCLVMIFWQRFLEKAILKVLLHKIFSKSRKITSY